jgi:nicotinate dehydrogenase subunit A
MATTSLNVNGKAVSVTVDDPDTPLLYVLRNDLGLHAPRFGCGLGQCGACTVHVDGTATRSCVTPLSTVSGKVVTLEGLGTDTRPHPLQTAFIEEQAVQCGYCINGMIMQSADLLARKPKPSEREIKSELAHNLCRCGTHLRIVRAVMRAAASS